jgi:phosphoribosylanthranilate isomerase
MKKIKICGLTDPSNVLEISKAGPDFIGYIFYQKSPRFVGTEPDPELFRFIPQGTKKVGVFVNEENQKILEISYRAELDLIQLHGSESPASCSWLRSFGLKVIKAFSLGQDFSFEPVYKYLPFCDYFLFDTKSEKPGGSGIKFNWDRLKEYTSDKPFFLSGGIGPEDSVICRTLENRGFYAVDINSRFESEQGIKDVYLVRKFINEIKKTET